MEALTDCALWLSICLKYAEADVRIWLYPEEKVNNYSNDAQMENQISRQKWHAK